MDQTEGFRFQLLPSFYIQIFPSSPEYRFSLFKQLHEIVFYGKGGYDFDTVYNLPIWLRNFIYREINEHYKKEAEAVGEKSTNVNKNKTEQPVIPQRAYQGKSVDKTIRRPGK